MVNNFVADRNKPNLYAEQSTSSLIYISTFIIC